MANIYPPLISQHEGINDSEKLIIEKLSSLDDGYHIFHSLAWTDRHDLECTFIIFNELKGFITLEVVSSPIDFDGKRWSIINTDGTTRHVKDPLKTAQDCMRAVKDVYEKKFNSKAPGVCTWGICLCNFIKGSGYSTLDLNDFNIIDYNNIDHINDWIDNHFSTSNNYHKNRLLTEIEKNNFLSLIDRGNNITLTVKRISFEINRKNASADMMQDYLIDLLEDKNHIVIQGASGTGKTWLAMKKASRLSESGKRVLFLSFNREVNEYVSFKLRSYKNIEVMTFHSFANNIIKEYISSELGKFACENDFFSCIDDLRRASDIKATPCFKHKRGCSMYIEHRIQSAIFSIAELKYKTAYDAIIKLYENKLPLEIIDIISLLIPDEQDNVSFYNERLPLVLSLVFENDNWNVERFTYDAVIIDEGHDFHRSWCDSLQNLFEQYRNKTVYVFYDENQTLYRREKELPIRNLISKSDHNNYIFRLSYNIRNTADIHHYSVAKTGLAGSARPSDINGISPFEIDFNDANLAVSYTEKLLDELINQHGIDPISITVLSNRTIEKSIYAKNKKIGRYSLSSTGILNKENIVRYRTVYEFKGLESDIVIFVLHKREEEFADKSRYLSEELLYVGFTRARYLLYILNIF